jgi:hypothetical protein
VCVLLETRLLHAPNNTDDDHTDLFLANATVVLEQETGVHFSFSYNETACLGEEETDANTERYCIQRWELCSEEVPVNGDFSGLKPLRFVVYNDTESQFPVRVNLNLHITHDLDDIQRDMELGLTASLNLYADEDLTLPRTLFLDCEKACALVALNLPLSALNDFNLTLDKISICSTSDPAGLIVPFNPSDPAHSGCNSEAVDDVVVLYQDSASTEDGDDLDLVFVSEPPFAVSQVAFCFKSKKLASGSSLVQVDWHATYEGDGDTVVSLGSSSPGASSTEDEDEDDASITCSEEDPCGGISADVIIVLCPEGHFFIDDDFGCEDAGLLLFARRGIADSIWWWIGWLLLMLLACYALCPLWSYYAEPMPAVQQEQSVEIHQEQHSHHRHHHHHHHHHQTKEHRQLLLHQKRSHYHHKSIEKRS